MAGQIDDPNEYHEPSLLNCLMLFNLSDSVTVTNLTVIHCTLYSHECGGVDGAGCGLLTFLGSHAELISITNSSFAATSPAVAATYGSFVMANTAFDDGVTDWTHLPMVTIRTTGTSFVSISKCTFTNAGQVWIDSSNVTVNDSMFFNNSAISEDAVAMGGVLRISSETLNPTPYWPYDGTGTEKSHNGMFIIGNCTFVRNSNTVRPVTDSDSDLGIKNIVGFGGALLLMSALSDDANYNDSGIIQNCSFFENSAVSGGGIGTWGMANVMISSCYFQRNFASSGAGAAVRSFGLQANLMHMVYLENVTVSESLFGSADTANCDVVLESSGCATAQSSHFVNSLGAGLCIIDVGGRQCSDYYKTTPVAFLSMPGFSVYDYGDNAREFIGYQDSINDISVQVTNCVFSGHTSFPASAANQFVGGAGLRLESLPVSLLTGLVFSDNRARQGAALHLKACDKTVLLDSSFVDNTASHEGGSIALVDTGEAGLLIGATNITNCSALRGGAVYGSPGTAMVITNGSRLTNNTAVTDGGAVYCNGCQYFALTGSAIVWRNVASGSGGGCYFDACVLLTLTGIGVYDNRSAVSHSALLCFSVLCSEVCSAFAH